MITIYMDIRETINLKDTLQDMGAKVILRQLPVGDFIVSEKMVIERKTRSDFESSIIDGRLYTQLKNLTDHFQDVIILVEGIEYNERINRKAIFSSYGSIVGKYGASVITSKNSKETAEIIYGCAKKEQIEDKRKVYIKGKRKALTLAEEQRAVIEALPGIGPQTALNLLNHFGKVSYILNSTVEELKEVDKIGPKKAERIKQVIDEEFVQ